MSKTAPVLLLSLMGFACSSTTVRPEIDPKSARENLNVLVENSFLKTTVAEFPGLVQTSLLLLLDDESIGVNPERSERVRRGSVEHLREDKIQGQMVAFLSRQMDVHEAALAADWVRNKSVQRIHELSQHTQPDSQHEMRAFFQLLRETPADMERANLLARLIDSYGSATLDQRFGTLTVHTIATLFLASLDDGGEEKRLLEEKLRQPRVSGKTPSRQELIRVALFTYRRASEKELMTTVEFYESELGQKYHSSSILAYEHAIEHLVQLAIAPDAT